MSRKHFNIALCGNPNSGKSTLFNQLTGLNRKIGNFPGITVDKKMGEFTLGSDTRCRITDLPGTYSLHPNSPEEAIIINYLLDTQHEDYPDTIIYVTDIRELEKQLLLFSQLQDVGIPLILVVNMIDVIERDHIEIDIQKLQKKLQIPVIPLSSRTGEGLDILKKAILSVKDDHISPGKPLFSYLLSSDEQEISDEMEKILPHPSDYLKLLGAQHADLIYKLSKSEVQTVRTMLYNRSYETLKSQIRDTMSRFEVITPLVNQIVKRKAGQSSKSFILDRLLTHQIWGPLIFMTIMFILFQAIFSWSTIPMDLIESGFAYLTKWLRVILPPGNFADLFIDGVISGLGGIVVFIPQIAFMFLFVSILEESGYMARVVFMFDRIMRSFGLNGRSLIALISSHACAIPAIMSTRTIRSRKERLITIFVAPLMSCSARIPVYAILIGFAVPNQTVGGIFNLQGLTFASLFLLGVLFALLVAIVMKFAMPGREEGYLMISLPHYQIPYWKNVLTEVYSKVKSFVFGAGKIIIIISIILWFMANFGPGDAIQLAERSATVEATEKGMEAHEIQAFIGSKKLEASYAGLFGKSIEPAIRPLGYDWKIGIALLTSFAAREVFIGTLATIYSIENKDDTMLLRAKMAQDTYPETGEKVFTLATAFSLLIFYVIAMQCMSTLAMVRRETKGWTIPIAQFFIFGSLAYTAAYTVYRIFS